MVHKMISSAIRERSIADHRGDEGELGDDVARRRCRRWSSRRGPVKPEVGGDGLGVEPERGAGQRAGAVRRDVGARGPSPAAGRRRATAPGRARAGGGRAAPAGRAAGACGRAWPRPRCASAWATSASLQVGDQRARSAGVVAQVHPDEGGDLVVAGAAGAQPAAEVGAEPLDQAALQRGVAVLVGDRAANAPRDHVGLERVEPGEHRGQVVGGEQAGAGAARGRGPASRPGRTAPAASRSGPTPTARPAPRTVRRRSGSPTAATWVPDCSCSSSFPK